MENKKGELLGVGALALLIPTFFSTIILSLLLSEVLERLINKHNGQKTDFSNIIKWFLITIISITALTWYMIG